MWAYSTRTGQLLNGGPAHRRELRMVRRYADYSRLFEISVPVVGGGGIDDPLVAPLGRMERLNLLPGS